jgi:hypothetical protein
LEALTDMELREGYMERRAAFNGASMKSKRDRLDPISLVSRHAIPRA